MGKCHIISLKPTSLAWLLKRFLFFYLILLINFTVFTIMFFIMFSSVVFLMCINLKLFSSLHLYSLLKKSAWQSAINTKFDWLIGTDEPLYINAFNKEYTGWFKFCEGMHAAGCKLHFECGVMRWWSKPQIFKQVKMGLTRIFLAFQFGKASTASCWVVLIQFWRFSS